MVNLFFRSHIHLANVLILSLLFVVMIANIRATFFSKTSEQESLINNQQNQNIEFGKTNKIKLNHKKYWVFWAWFAYFMFALLFFYILKLLNSTWVKPPIKQWK
jgi:ABC-type Fe3+ transport system permease subunit